MRPTEPEPKTTRPRWRPLKGEDALFVYAETPTMPMHTLGTVVLDAEGVSGGFGYAEILEVVASRIHHLPPFRQRLVLPPLALGRPVLADDPEFDLERHMRRIAVPSPGTLRELALVVGDIAAHPLDRSKPLWEMWVVEGLSEGRVAVVTKMHHCMIDGASGSSQMAQLLDLEPTSPHPEPAEPWAPAPLPSSLEVVRRTLGHRWMGPGRFAGLLFESVRGLASLRSAELETRRAGLEPPPSPEETPKTIFNRSITEARSVAYGSASLDDLKRVKDAFGVTVNDAVLAACTVALRRYLEAAGALPGAPLACMVPVSLKSDREKQEFSNKVSLMRVRLPTQLTSPEKVIRAVHRETAVAKRVFDAVPGDLVSEWLELAPPLLVEAGSRLFSEWRLGDRYGIPANVLVSNMRGPPVPLYFGRARVEAVFPMGPVGEGMGLNITVLSNMGRLDVGVLAARTCVADPERIADGFRDAVTELRRAAEEGASEGEASTARSRGGASKRQAGPAGT